MGLPGGRYVCGHLKPSTEQTGKSWTADLFYTCCEDINEDYEDDLNYFDGDDARTRPQFHGRIHIQLGEAHVVGSEEVPTLLTQTFAADRCGTGWDASVIALACKK